MKISSISDTHGLLPLIEESEILFICGDIMPLNIQSNMIESFKWLKNDFLNWINQLSVKQVILIAGNHDKIFERCISDIYDLFRNTKVKYLFCENYDYVSDDGNVYHIYGSPYCSIFGNWSFMVENRVIKKRMSNMNDNIDFLITHDAPYGCSDIILDPKCTWRTNEHIGNESIREIILDKKPKYNLHGHLHCTNHDFEILGETLVVCVSLLDEHYKQEYEPLYLEV